MNAIRFNYLYRDGANFKSWGEVVFVNPEGLLLQPIEEKLLRAFSPDKQFIAHQIDIPEIFLFLSNRPTANDHCFHEFDSVEVCSDASSDLRSRTIGMFIKDVENASLQGWKAFDILVGKSNNVFT